ncbi:hypothetical protein ILUMI_14879 [Ignelater luminosus]|uniref:Peptidase aspartic putative domain-containing protein n=1 Tax=Ignelater luminosus TaxID=2038154 RepID=A0A8K0CPN8_IGNLU|nr:hypothetical protein ILUMI_14879 [Ignelater luminosus]
MQIANQDITRYYIETRNKSAASQSNRETQGEGTNVVEQISQIIINHISLSQNLSHLRNRTCPLLPTALVNVYDQINQPIVCKVLLNSGSQSHFVIYNLVKRLGLKLEPVDIPVLSINHIKTNINQMVNVDISSRHADFKRNLTFLVVPSITEYTPSTHLNASGFNVSSGLPLADPNFYLSSAINMLIGCDLFFELFLGGQIRIGKNIPLMQNTLLKWLVSGNISRVQNNSNSSVNAMPKSCLFTCETPIDFELRKFWVMEEIVPSRDTFLTKEKACMQSVFRRNNYSNIHEETRYLMSLPTLLYTITDNAIGSMKALGVSRIPSTDPFEYNAHNMHAYDNVKVTERSILSFIAKIFDPLGLLGPILISPKLIIEKLWKLQLDWDA